MELNFFTCICTYKRPHLLTLLLEDLGSQSVHSERVVIVDGDPSSGEVKQVISSVKNFHYIYLPSNHANISYQRYLGWRVAKDFYADVLLYLDDDMRIYQEDAVENLLYPFNEENETLVGTTSSIVYPNDSDLHKQNSDRSFRRSLHKIINSLSWKDSIVPGSINSTGVRILPNEFTEEGHGRVKWAYGGVMAYKMRMLGQDSFLADSFALHHIGCGLGEDTLISHIASFKGEILLIKGAQFVHPNADDTKAYPKKAFRFGYATAYSRRLINDHFHENAHKKDRKYLVRSYLSNNIINSINFSLSRNSYTFMYALGYKIGSLRGLIQQPSAKNLTPGINWWKDANDALSRVEVIL